MSTNSTIAVQLPDGSINGIYCHWNGYIEYNGLMLLTHYNTLQKAKRIIKHGYLSVLHSSVNAPKGKVHTFETPQPKVCIYYGRDRGDDNVALDKSVTWDDFVLEQGREYNYLFSGGKWYVSFNDNPDKVLVTEWVDNNMTKEQLTKAFNALEKY